MTKTIFFAKSDSPKMIEAFTDAQNTFKYLWRELSWEYRIDGKNGIGLCKAVGVGTSCFVAGEVTSGYKTSNPFRFNQNGLLFIYQTVYDRNNKI